MRLEGVKTIIGNENLFPAAKKGMALRREMDGKTCQGDEEAG